MVKLGFIVEGTTEKIVLGGSDFFNFLAGKKINFVQEIIDAGGNGNLLPHNIRAFTEVLEEKGATHIVILTDLDNDQCITNTKNRIAPLPNQIVIVSVKAIESWFLSDTTAIREYFKDATFTHANPEIVNDPYEEIKLIRMAKMNRGPVSKTVLANKMVRDCHFSIQRAAQHPNCNSAKYFLKKIADTASGK